MWIIGGGIMFAGLIMGGLSGSLSLCLEITGVGLVILACAQIKEYTKEKRAQEWRKNYPVYRY